jgi:hypothetical protein
MGAVSTETIPAIERGDVFGRHLERRQSATYRNEICVNDPKNLSSAVGETEMIADPKRKPDQDNGDSDKRRRQEEELDEALKNTFPASDPVSMEQP